MQKKGEGPLQPERGGDGTLLSTQLSRFRHQGSVAGDQDGNPGAGSALQFWERGPTGAGGGTSAAADKGLPEGTLTARPAPRPRLRPKRLACCLWGGHSPQRLRASVGQELSPGRDAHSMPSSRAQLRPAQQASGRRAGKGPCTEQTLHLRMVAGPPQQPSEERILRVTTTRSSQRLASEEPR